jgi:hypothetical protein
MDFRDIFPTHDHPAMQKVTETSTKVIITPSVYLCHDNRALKIASYARLNRTQRAPNDELRLVSYRAYPRQCLLEGLALMWFIGLDRQCALPWFWSTFRQLSAMIRNTPTACTVWCRFRFNWFVVWFFGVVRITHEHHSLIDMATTLAALATVVSLISGVQGHIPGQVFIEIQHVVV